MKLIVDISEESYKRCCVIADLDDSPILKAIKNGTPFNDLRGEIEDYITHCPYIKSFIDCCRLRGDVMRIIDKYKTETR